MGKKSWRREQQKKQKFAKPVEIKYQETGQMGKIGEGGNLQTWNLEKLKMVVQRLIVEL